MKHVWLYIRIGLTVALFWWLLRDPALRGKLAALPAPAESHWFLAAWITAGLNELFGFLRFWFCAAIAGVPITVRRAAALHFLGLFTSLFLPGTVGGDAVKIALIATQFPQRKLCGLIAVLMDRICGFVVIMVWTLSVSVARADWFRTNAETTALFHGVVGLILFALIGLCFWYITSRPFFRDRHPRWLPMRDYILQISTMFDLFFRDWKRAAAALLLTVGTHTTFFITYYFAALAYSAPLRMGDALSIMPFMDVVAMLPVTFSGLGLREVTLETLLPPLCGVSPEVAIVTSLAGFFTMASWALFGAPVFLFTRLRERKEAAP